VTFTIKRVRGDVLVERELEPPVLGDVLEAAAAGTGGTV
jgi:hypothetical protein